jgi:hypothetical protein
MSKHRNYQESEVVQQLNQKSDILIPRDTKKIFMLHGVQARGDVGIKSRGKVDFLHTYHGYTPLWVTSFKGL